MTRTMDMAERLPSMSEKDLRTLRGNAERLGRTGSSKQQTEATRLLPLIEAELADRKSREPPRTRRTRTTAKA